MKSNTIGKITILALIFLLSINFLTYSVRAQNQGSPTPLEAFGHTFDENYWDTNIFNNSRWDHPDVNPEVSWLNNTWNMKWIKEGNFEMGMLSFLNKTAWESGKEVVYTTPAEMWWQHAYLNGSEIFIASLHCAWFGFSDTNQNRYYDEGENINPFFYMGATTPQMVNDVGIKSNPTVEKIPLQRSVSGDIVTYEWGYNYTDIIFYVPKIDHLNQNFSAGFNYSDPGTYLGGSEVIGNQTYISYNYKLEINTGLGVSNLYQDYESGKFGVLKHYNESSGNWELVSPGEQGYMPEDWAMCLGTWSFIMADQDYALSDLQEGEINATAHKTGLTEVKTTLGGNHAFDFKFNQKPTYDLDYINGTTMGTFNTVYECLDVNNDQGFIDFASGMIHLIGDFAKLILSYAVNQTNRFTNGIPFDVAYEAFHPNETAAFFITCYPEYGESGGGRLVHDPSFTAYFSVQSASGGIPGFSVGILLLTLMVGVSVIILKTPKIRKKL
ncbi:MAG: hypothetical protein GF317_09410 [Candidatus Lokiarchaeota archaeon]|nr:hypothetical protein [Candidatus Lokiarchaeota archaeon]MBD3199929.1 hypothetical protein [Candidatus Lokiarchaeota archaeon]